MLSNSDAGRTLGSIRTEKKAATSAENGRRGGRPAKPLSEIRCTCGTGEGPGEHKTYCLRGQAIRRRQAAGKL